jgi:hypothetical protein
MRLISERSLAFFGIFRALEQMFRFSLRAVLADTVRMTAPKAHRSDAWLFQVAQGAGRSVFPVFGQADAGHQFLLEIVIRRT